jgi:hypothetical protein
LALNVVDKVVHDWHTNGHRQDGQQGETNSGVGNDFVGGFTLALFFLTILGLILPIVRCYCFSVLLLLLGSSLFSQTPPREGRRLLANAAADYAGRLHGNAADKSSYRSLITASGWVIYC